MWFPAQFRELVPVDTTALLAKVLSLPETAWHADDDILQDLTKKRPVNVIFLKSIDNQKFRRQLSLRALEQIDVPNLSGWDILNEAVQPLLDEVLTCFPAGGVITRIQIPRLGPGEKIVRHRDTALNLMASHRIHIPLKTNQGVKFRVDGKLTPMQVGNSYELNNRLFHSVFNESQEDRIHLIIDYLPPANNKPQTLLPAFEIKSKQRMLDTIKPPPQARYNYPLPKVLATSVIRGANKNESHGGMYLIDLQSEEVQQVVDWNTGEIDFQGRGWDRGLRGIAFYGDKIFVAASDELFCFDKTFKIIESFRSPYLKHAHEIVCYQDHLLVTSTGFDSVLRFNLNNKKFDKGWIIRANKDKNLTANIFDPQKKGPAPGNSIHLNNVFENEKGIYISSRNIPKLLRLDNSGMHLFKEIPMGTHNARPYGDGIIYNDTNADLLVNNSDQHACCLAIPRYTDEKIQRIELADSNLARQAFGRGLAVYQDDIVIAGSSPSTITVYDLQSKSLIKSVNISMDIRNAIHGLEVWPFNS